MVILLLFLAFVKGLLGVIVYFVLDFFSKSKYNMWRNP